MPATTLTVSDVAAVLPAAKRIKHIADGGQKRVFRAELNGVPYAIKFMCPTIQQVAGCEVGADVSVTDDVTARAVREVETMKRCRTPYLVKQGPIGLKTVEIRGEHLLYFTEEFIDGETLKDRLARGGPLSIAELVRLGTNIAMAIEELWSINRIHRDVKPGNIMARAGGDFVLLDMGLVFDLDDRSFSLGPVGTMAYFSPEQVDFQNRRNILDFRSDTFSLGIVLYQMATMQHPFAAGAANSWEVLANIQRMQPKAPRDVRHDLPEEMNGLILRLLGKRPSLRYRTPQMLLDALSRVPI